MYFRQVLSGQFGLSDPRGPGPKTINEGVAFVLGELILARLRPETCLKLKTPLSLGTAFSIEEHDGKLGAAVE